MGFTSIGENEKVGLWRGKLNTMLTELYSTKVESPQVLTLTNITPFVPTSNYNPAPKLYVDETFAGFLNTYDPTNINADAFDRSNHYGDIDPGDISTDSDNRFVSDAEKTVWNAKEPGIGSKGTAFNKNFGTTADTVAEGDHSHTKAEIGLDLVQNLAPLDLPVSNATSIELSAKASVATTYTRVSIDAMFEDTRAIDDYLFGDVTNNAEFDTTGFLSFSGSATYYIDDTFEMHNYRLYSQVGSLSYNFVNSSITMSSGGDITSIDDILVFTSQMPHQTKLNSTAYLHVHFEQPSNADFTFDVQWRVQRNGQLKTTSWSATTTVHVNTDSVFTYSSGTLIQITKLLDIDLTGLELSSLLQFKLTRSDSESGDLELLAVDIHYECDTLGSNTQYSKS